VLIEAQVKRLLGLKTCCSASRWVPVVTGLWAAALQTLGESLFMVFAVK
jgi:hypothetical protein